MSIGINVARSPVGSGTERDTHTRCALIGIEGIVNIEMSRPDAELVREMLRQRVKELDMEINRTDRLAFKHELQDLERSVERILGDVSAALESTGDAATGTAGYP